MGGDRVTSSGTGPIWRTQASAASSSSGPIKDGATQNASEGDRLAAKDPTVGQYVEEQIRQAGETLKTDSEVAAITVVAGPVVAVIEARHLNQARERIAKLPMDPEGHWKQAAANIVAEENAAAKQEILGLPGRAAQGVVDGANAVANGVQAGVTAAAQAADQAWGQAKGAFKLAYDYAKDAVPKAFGELATDSAVAAIALNPLGVGPSAVIVGNHMASAYERISKLPMDPEGHWKEKAATIIAEEQEGAKKDILALPGKAYQGVVDTANIVYASAAKQVATVRDGIAGIVDQTLKTVEHATAIAEWEVESRVSNLEHGVANEVSKVRHGVGGWLKELGKTISGD